MAGPDHRNGPDEGKGDSNKDNNDGGRKRTLSSMRATMSVTDMKQGRASTTVLTTRRGCNAAAVKVGDFPLNVPLTLRLGD